MSNRAEYHSLTTGQLQEQFEAQYKAKVAAGWSDLMSKSEAEDWNILTRPAVPPTTIEDAVRIIMGNTIEQMRWGEDTLVSMQALSVPDSERIAA